ncbi:MAG: response regulator [Candidatus Cloacimonadota bacterium]|nr:response regulator [Candidatus Cloacimonadota bacterium]
MVKLNISVLYVEDDTLIREFVAKMLKKKVASVTTAVNGIDGLKKFQRFKPDLILTDIKMDKMGGLDMISKLKKDYPDLKFVVVSAYDQTDYFLKAIEMDVKGFILKPINRKKLFKVLEEQAHYILSEHRLNQKEKEKQKAKQALEKSESKYRNLVERVEEGIVSFDRDFNFTFANKAACEIFGFPKKASNEYNLFYFLEDTQTKEELKKADFQIKPASNELEVTIKNLYNEEKIITIRLRELIENEKLVGSFGIINDITEKKHLEDEISRTQKLESLGVMAGGLAHDFNNILTTILSNIDFAKYNLNNKEKIKKILDEATTAILRAQKLTEQLLTFAKGGKPKKKTIYIRKLLRETTEFVLRGSNVKPVYDIEKNLNPVNVDEGQLNQALNNILINANHAMQEGGILELKAENYQITEVDFLPLRNGEYVKIDIKDQGNGIPKNIIHKIFDPFFTTKPKGSGLGLSTAFSIIKKHQGYIDVRSVRDEGTTFSIYLPASRDSAQKSDKTYQKKVQGNNQKILLMDDEPTILDIASEMLNHLGFKVETSLEGKEAIEKYKKALSENDPFQLVIMDLTVPGGMGGKKTIEELKKIDENVTAIVSSGYSLDPVLSNYEDYGFQGVLTKPYKIEDIMQVLNKIFNQKS